MQVSDGGPLIDERYVVDPSFLDLVRLGVKRADDPVIRNTVAVVDDQLSYPTANGRFWHRASFDGYGEQRDGSQWEPSDPGSGKTIGRGWPLLGGERGEYELQLAGMQATARGPAGHDGPGRRRRQPPDGRAGLGPQPAGRHAGVHPGRADAVGDAAGLDARAVPAAGPRTWTRAATSRRRRSVACRYGSEACRS